MRVYALWRGENAGELQRTRLPIISSMTRTPEHQALVRSRVVWRPATPHGLMRLPHYR